MANVVDFNMLVDINRLLKEHNIEYSFHAVGGCSCCGLQLRCDGQAYDETSILELVNTFLKKELIVLEKDEDQDDLYRIVSKFDYCKKIND